MAITSTTPPAIRTIATRPINWEFVSDTANIVRLIIEVWVDNVNNTIQTIEINPEPGTVGDFKTDLKAILSNFVSFTLPNIQVTDGVATTLSQTSAFREYGVRVWEVLDDGSTNYPVSPDYISGSYFTHNIVLTHKQFTSGEFDLDDYDMTTGVDNKFLTSSPARRTIVKGYDDFLSMHVTDSTQFFRREYFDVNDTPLATQDFPIPNNNSDQYGKSSEFLANAAYVLVTIVDAGLSAVSETKRFDFIDQCGQDLHIIWENQFGGYDSYTFRGRVVERLRHKSKTFQQPLGAEYTSADRGFNVLENMVEHDFDVYTRSESKELVNWIQSGLINKRAWTQENGLFYPIIIDDGSEIIEDSENPVYKLGLSFKYANDTYGSRG